MMKRDNLTLMGRGPGQQLPAPVAGQQLPGAAERKIPAVAGRKPLKRVRQKPVPLEQFARVVADRDAEDREFLPEALEILETPASPTRIWLIYALCGLLASALAWSWFGHLDVYAD